MSHPIHPAYVELDGGIVFRPPYLQADTFLSAWVIASDKAAQQRLLDQAFNAPSGGAVDYRAVTSHAILCFADIGKLSSLDPRDRGFGYTEEVDAVLWILAGAYRGGVLDHLVFYCPYIFVTNSFAMAAGREVFGYPKTIAWTKPPTSPADPGPLWAETMVLPRYDPSTDLVRKRVLTLSREGGEPDLLSFGAGDAVAAVATLIERLLEAGVEIEATLLLGMLGDLFSVKVAMVFLKQFRDASTPDRAAYQAIVEAPARVTAFRGAGLLPPGWTLEIERYDSLHPGEALGLGARQSVDLGFWLDFDFALDLGREVWRAP